VKDVEKGIEELSLENPLVFYSVTLSLKGFSGPILSPLGDEPLYLLYSSCENSAKKDAIREALRSEASAEQAAACRSTLVFVNTLFSEILNELEFWEGGDTKVLKELLTRFKKELPAEDYKITKREVVIASLEVYLIGEFLSYYSVVENDVSEVDVETIVDTILTSRDFSSSVFKLWIDKAVNALGAVKNALATTSNGVGVLTQEDIAAILSTLLGVG